jgi:SAM-dependent methyltransferase
MSRFWPATPPTLRSTGEFITNEKGVTAGAASSVRPEFTGERVAIGHGDSWWRGEARDSEHMARYAFALSRIPAGSSVIDVACGTGYGSGIDPATIDFARTQCPEASFEVADATALPRADASVDAVLSFETIEHLPDPSSFFGEVAGVVKSDGVFFVSTPDRPVYALRSGPNDLHVAGMDRAEFAFVLERHFKVDCYGQTLFRSPSRLGRRIDRLRAWMRGRSSKAALAQFSLQPLDERPWVFLVAVCRPLPTDQSTEPRREPPAR